MEEQVGEIWHKLVTRMAGNGNASASVSLTDVQKTIGIFFRALGGDGGLQIESADATVNYAQRNWMQRLAGTNTKIQLAWRDDRSLRLPQEISWFDKTELNKDLYFWLSALAACQDENSISDNWFYDSQRLTRDALDKYPGVAQRYKRLMENHLLQRPDPETLAGQEAEAETAIQQALREPGSVEDLPVCKRPPQPVPLWLHPEPPMSVSSQSDDNETGSNQSGGQAKEIEELGRRQAERVEEPEGKQGLITVRMENIFTMGEFVNVDRGTEDEEDIERAENVAKELDKLSISKNATTSKTTLKFDLDLPSASEDDLILSDGILLPEWDWKKQELLPDRCRIVEMRAEEAQACDLPAHLSQTAKKLRNQFQALMPAKVWYNAQPDGQDIDLDAYLRYTTDRAAGFSASPDNLYKEFRSGARDLSCLLLADLSLSTDAHIDNQHRIIDVIRDSLFLFAESLNATGDRFSMYGFSSRKRNPIRVHTLKDFDEPYNGQIRGRIDAIKPGYYTRMGAGIRHATELLKNEASDRRLLLVLTDGKPNDLDQYEGRYGIEDTRQAVIAARKLGLQPFCVTIDKKGSEYLPHIFSSDGYAVIRKPEQLPRELPHLYALLTQ